MGCIYKDICSLYESDGSCEASARLANKCIKNIDSSIPSFYSESVQGDFIKGLVNNYALPNYNTVRVGDYAVAGIKYLYGNKVIEVTTSGVIGDTCVFSEIRTQEFGKHYVKLSEVFTSGSQVYDTVTHERLGDFLRCYRDIYGVNLMPLYNCNSSRQTSDFYISSTKGVLETKNKLYRVHQVPIKFNKTYSVALDCNSAVSIAPAFILNNRLIQVSRDTLPSDISKTLFTTENTQFIIGSDFKKPNLVTISAQGLEYEKELQEYEKWLYLLIQVPLDCTSSLVVIEGDYTHPTTRVEVSMGELPTSIEYYDPSTYFSTHSSITFEDQTSVEQANRRYVQYCDIEGLMMCIQTHTVNAGDTVQWYPQYFQRVSNFKAAEVSRRADKEYVSGLTDGELDELMYGNLFLLQMNDGVQHPYSNNLISYLLRHCITSNEDISENIKKVEQALIGTAHSLNTVTGIWDTATRDALFSTAMENVSAGRLDALGFVDKNLESYLSGVNTSVIW